MHQRSTAKISAGISADKFSKDQLNKSASARHKLNNTNITDNSYQDAPNASS